MKKILQNYINGGFVAALTALVALASVSDARATATVTIAAQTVYGSGLSTETVPTTSSEYSVSVTGTGGGTVPTYMDTSPTVYSYTNSCGTVVDTNPSYANLISTANHYARFALSGSGTVTVTVTIKTGGPTVSSATTYVSPVSDHIVCTCTSTTITFTLSPQTYGQNLFVNLNGAQNTQDGTSNTGNPLFIFVDPLDTPPTGSTVYYLPSGTANVGGPVTAAEISTALGTAGVTTLRFSGNYTYDVGSSLTSAAFPAGLTIYIDDGAYVMGEGIDTYPGNGLTVTGRGSFSGIRYNPGPSYYQQAWGVKGNDNVTVKNLLFLDQVSYDYDYVTRLSS